MTDYPLIYRHNTPPGYKGRRCRVAVFSRDDGQVNAGNYRQVTFEFEDGSRLVEQQRRATRRWNEGAAHRPSRRDAA